MPSPFPGMDPYLEGPSIWGDFHFSLLGVIKETLNTLLPEPYSAWADQYVWLVAPEKKRKKKLTKPDTFVVDEYERDPQVQAGTLTIDAPAYTTLQSKRKKGNRYLKIIDRESRRIVTVLEMLSPSNKSLGGDRKAYLSKRDDSLAAGANLVEIDFLRAGEPMPMGKHSRQSDYSVLVCSASEFPKSGVWWLSVRDALPPIPIPLSPGDEPIFLPLRDCLDRAYDGNRYDKSIDYSQPPKPPLKKSDAAWARKLLKQKKILVD